MSHLVGLPVSWHEANSTPTMEWGNWLDLFQVAVMAKFSTSTTELTREVNEQTPRARAFLGDMDEDPAKKSSQCAVSVTWRGGKEAIQR